MCGASKLTGMCVQMVVKLAEGAKWLSDKPVGIAMLRSMTWLKAKEDRSAFAVALQPGPCNAA